jgi:hypothetical protein
MAQAGEQKMDTEETLEDEQMHSDGEEDDEDQPSLPANDERIYSLDVLKVVKEAQQARGLRHGDYTRYR